MAKERFHEMISRVAKKKGAHPAIKQAEAAFVRLHGKPSGVRKGTKIQSPLAMGYEQQVDG